MLEEGVARVVHDYKGFSPVEIQHEAVNKAMRLVKILGVEGFDDITLGEVNIIIDVHSEPQMFS